jgi:hypothetical protein
MSGQSELGSQGQSLYQKQRVVRERLLRFDQELGTDRRNPRQDPSRKRKQRQQHFLRHLARLRPRLRHKVDVETGQAHFFLPDQHRFFNRSGRRHSQPELVAEKTELAGRGVGSTVPTRTKTNLKLSGTRSATDTSARWQKVASRPNQVAPWRRPSKPSSSRSCRLSASTQVRRVWRSCTPRTVLSPWRCRGPKAPSLTSLR